jgi:glucose-6-phosphate 1-dehydrogenase
MIDKNDIIIIGGQGDLAYRKLYPALYHLDEANCFGDDVRIIGLGREPMEEQQFIDSVKANFIKYEGDPAYVGEPEKNIWDRFVKRLSFYCADVLDVEQVKGLSALEFNKNNRPLTIYLATPPSIFQGVCETFNKAGLISKNTRIVVEKPLGHNEVSFKEINHGLMKIFKEEQVYRIDHYLGKETVQNLLALRFANAFFEPIWNSRYIDHVQINVAESVGAEGRWNFYDDAGAMRDMVQNHLLQLLCLVAMEPPPEMKPDLVRDEKLKVLLSLKELSPSEIKNDTVRGQYVAGVVGNEKVCGYLEEKDAKRDASTTETFVAIKTEIKNWRWAGVPFYLRTGKRLPQRFSDIVIQFKKVPHTLFNQDFLSNNYDRLIIRLQPNEGIRMQLVHKLPGFSEDIELKDVTLNLTYDEAFAGRRLPSAYERLILDVMRGNSTLFMRSDELEAAWRWVDSITEHWEEHKQKAIPYTAGTWGPSEAEGLIARDRRAWKNFEL